MRGFVQTIGLGLVGWTMGAVSLIAKPTPIPKDKVLVGKFSRILRVSGVNKSLRVTGTFVVSPLQGVIWQCLVPFSIVYAVGRGGVYEKEGEGPLEKVNTPFVRDIEAFGRCLKALFSGDALDKEGEWIVEEGPPKGDEWEIKVVAKHLPYRRVFPTIIASGHHDVESVNFYSGDVLMESKEAPPFCEITLSDTQLTDKGALSPQVRSYLEKVDHGIPN